MADQEIRLRITTEGGKSIADIKAELKALVKEFESVPIASTRTKELGTQIKSLRDQMSEARKAAESSNSAMMRSYFTLGEELRRKATPSVVEFNRIIQDAPFGITGVVNNVQRLTETFVVLRAEAGSTAAAMKAMVSSMLTGPMGIMLLVSVVSSLVVIFGKDLVNAISSTKKEFASLMALAGDQKKFMQIVMGVAEDGDVDKAISMYRARVEAAKADKEMLQALQATTTMEQGRTEIAIRTAAARGRASARGSRGGGGDVVEPGPFDGFLAGWSRNPQKIGLSSGGDMQIGKGPMARADVAISAQFDKADAAFLGLQSSFMAGISAMSSSTSIIGDAFASVFGGARTLLGSFAKAFADTMTQLATKYAIGLLFQSIGGGFFGSLGGSIMQGLGIGEKSGSVAAANAGMMAVGGQGSGLAAEVRGMRRAIESGVWRVKGDDIVFSSSRASQKRLSLQYGV